MHEALAHDHFQTTCGRDRPTRRDCSYLYGCRRYTVIYISKPIPNSLNFRIEILPYSDCLAVLTKINKSSLFAGKLIPRLGFEIADVIPNVNSSRKLNSGKSLTSSLNQYH